ncbi:PH domain-containing protein [Actinomadura monticuli]|uniref:PH domain-containing protein n=1 Tax=Actinomadura monticuli TaxID=3097367 RepID=A0ABV4Q5G1_9ACTN
MEDRVQLRNGARRQFLGLVLAMNIALWFSVGVIAVQGKDVDTPSVVVLVVTLLLLVKFWRSGTAVSADGVEIRKFFGGRSVAWRDISDISVAHHGKWRHVAIRTNGGDLLKLSAPADWWPRRDAFFDEGLQEIMRRWEKHGTEST